MATVETKEFPAGIYPYQMTSTPRAANNVFRAASGIIQTTVQSGAFWAYKVSFRNLPLQKRRMLRAAITSLNGRQHRMSLPIFEYEGPQNKAAHTAEILPLSDIKQIGNQLKVIKTDVLSVGDLFSLNRIATPQAITRKENQLGELFNTSGIRYTTLPKVTSGTAKLEATWDASPDTGWAMSIRRDNNSTGMLGSTIEIGADYTYPVTGWRMYEIVAIDNSNSAHTLLTVWPEIRSFVQPELPLELVNVRDTCYSATDPQFPRTTTGVYTISMEFATDLQTGVIGKV